VRLGVVVGLDDGLHGHWLRIVWRSGQRSRRAGRDAGASHRHGMGGEW